MKLIQIFALATAMATLAGAQNTTPANPPANPNDTPKRDSVNKKPSGASSSNTGSKKATTAGTGSKTGTVNPQNSATKTDVTGKKISGTAKNKTKSGTAVNATKSGAETDKTKSGAAADKTKSGAAVKTPKSAAAGGSNTSGTTGSPASGKAGKTAQANPVKKADGTSGKDAAKSASKTANKKKGAVAGGTTVRVVGPTVSAKSGKTSTVGTTGPATGQLAGSHGRRDPFLSPLRRQEGVVQGSPTAPCSTGKRCLTIPELVLQGTVKDTTGKMMALVATGTHTYMLRENDQVFNGSVVKITSDSIVFREYGIDKFGNQVPHEVIKKMGPAT
ncbi:MAG TPA: hypothetical protein VN176_11565 [Verrucomicrobiae bacterium]|nr:hypothetical protein [Verrucomicrobiae bacterium]